MMRDDNMWGSGNNNDDEVGLPDMSDMPTGRFNPDDLEFESFMFDQGEGPSTAVQTQPPASGWSAQGGTTPASAMQMDSPFVGQASMPPAAPPMPAPQPHQAAPLGMTGQNVPVPPYLQGNEPGGAPFVSFVVPNGSSTGTGPLAGAPTQAQADAPPQPEVASNTGADTPASTKVGTGPLSARVSGTSPATQRGTGPLTQRINNAGSPGRRGPAFPPSDTPLYEQPEAQPTPTGANAHFPGISLHEGNGYVAQPAASLAPAPAAPEVAPDSAGPFTMSPMPYQNGAGAAVVDPLVSNDMGWSDGVLASVEDFSVVLVAMRSSKQSSVMDTTEVAPAPQEAEPAPVAEARPAEKRMPAWVERAALGEELAARLSAEANPQVESQAAVLDAPQVEEEVAAPPVTQEVEAEAEPEPIQVHMAVDDTPPPASQEADETLPAVAQGSFGTSDLVFEQFMFDSGTTSAPLAEQETEEAMPSMEAMEAEVEQPGQAEQQPTVYAEAPVQVELEVEAPRQEEQVADLAEIHALEFKETGDDGAPLPFWLSDTSNLDKNGSFLQEAEASGVPEMFASPAVEAVESEAPVEEPAEPEPAYMEMEPVAEVAMAEMAMSEMAMSEQAAHDEPAPEDAQEEAPEDDYSDLPPIAPFDFTALNLADQGESLGFNTEELLGIVPERHEGMRATTDLAALADLLGISPASGVLREVPTTASTANFGAATGQIAEQEPAPAPAPVQPVMEDAPIQPVVEDAPPASAAAAAQEKAPVAQPADVGRTASWTSTVTSHLSLDTERDLSGNMAEGAASETDGTEKLAVADLDVDPFDFTQLNLDEDEAATGFLDTTKMKMAGTTVLESVPEPQDTVEQERIEPFAELYDAEQAEGGAESDDLSGGTMERDSELDTSFFLTARQTGRKGGSKATGRLDEATLQPVQEPAATPDAAGTEPSPEPVAARADNSFKAKVLQPGKSERDMRTLHNLEAEEPVEVEAQAPGEQQAHVEPNDDTEKPLAMGQAEEAGSPEEEETMGTQSNGRSEGPGGSGSVAAASMPSRNDMMMSGPLPTLDGFDELQAMVTANPNDIGAHMALALAYTQVGDLDTSLRVYRRILKKRTISPGILQLIVEELSDFEADANGRPHFHQVRGDLYMKQGRFHEAVQEYNKIS